MHRLVASALLVFAAFSQHLSAQPGSHPCTVLAGGPERTFTIKVLDVAGARISTASVEAECGDLRRATSTGTEGVYSLRLPRGTYHLKIAAPGFTPVSREITVALESGGNALEVTLSVAKVIDTVTVIAPPGYVAVGSTAGSKLELPLIETPQSISIATREQMDAQNVQRIEESMRYAAGTTAESGGADLRFDGYTVNARGFSVDPYLDGMKLLAGSFAIPQIDPNFLERVELLYGPSSVLYGQASPGGVLNMASKRPQETPLREVRIQTGNYGSIQGALDLTGAIDRNQRFLYRLTGLGRRTGTQVDHTKYERLAIAPALTWRRDGTVLTLLTGFQRDPGAGFYNQLPHVGTLLPNPNGQIPTSFFSGDPDFTSSLRNQQSLGYLFSHQFNSRWTVRQNLRYMHQSRDEFGAYPFGYGSDGHTLNRGAYNFRQRLHGITLDNHVQTTFETGSLRHLVLMGVDYQHLNNDARYAEDDGPPLDYLNPVYQPVSLPANPSFAQHNDQRQYQVGLYAQDQLKWGRWSLTAGIRNDWTESAATNLLNNTKTSKPDSAFTGRAGLVYVSSYGIAPYFTYSASFQPQSGADFAGTPFKPVTGRQSEAGIRYQPRGFRGFVRLSAYNLTQQNVPTPDTDPAHTAVNPFAQAQKGEIRSRGIELEGRMNPFNGLNVLASVSYLHNIISKANDDTLGKRPVGNPVHTAALWADYTFGRRVLPGFGFNAGVRFTGETYGHSDNSIKVPSFAILDAALRYDFAEMSPLNGTRLFVNASNLADGKYIVSAHDFGAYYGLRRNVQAGFAFRW